MRICHGALSSATNPLSYSLVADYYPPDKRGTPNAILSTGNFIGIALSSISILLIKSFGWRSTYGIMGIVGIIPAILSLILVRDPR
jgi:MFS family permease